MGEMVIRDEVRRLPAYRFTHHPQPVKLDQNEAPDDAPELARAVAGRVEGVQLNRYPAIHAVDLEAALAVRHGWPVEGVVVANGSNVLIQALTIAAGIGRTVLTVAPTFAVYASQARLLGAELLEVPLAPGFTLPEDGLVAALEGRSGVAFLADPAAPTGGRMDPPGVERFARAAHATGRWLTVIDEAYAEFAGVDHARLARELDSVVLLRTFSKALGLAGARLGYALAAPELAVHLRKVLLPFSVSALQVAAGLAALERPEAVAQRVTAVVAERERLAAALRTFPGIEVFPSVTNFVLFRVDDPGAVHSGLLERGVVVRRQDHLPGLEGCLRVTAGLPQENDAFLRALEGVLAAEAARG